MNDEDILRIKEPFDTDESIRRYEFVEYQPVTGTSLNTTGEIRVIIESQDEFYHPSEAYLLIEGKLVKTAASAAYGNADKVALVNNGAMYLFSNIRYELSGHEIESLNHPGQATTIKGLLKYSTDYAMSRGMNQCWAKDSTNDADQDKNDGFKIRQKYIVSGPDPNGTFSFSIPLKHVFGFAEDYDKVTYGLRHVLTMVRQSNDESIFRDVADPGSVILSKIALHMPRVLPNDQEKLKLMKIIEDRTRLTVGFRTHQCDTITVPRSTSFSWRLSVKTSPENPRWVIIGFQTEKSGDQKKNPAVFDHCKAKRVWIELNGTPYPALEREVDFTKYQISSLYNSIPNFLATYYGMTNAQSNISPMDFISLFPLHVIDLTKQPERIKNGVMDMSVRAVFGDTVADKTQAFALVISDRILTFYSDGSRMNVTY